MQIDFTNDKRLIEFRPESLSEQILLDEFPAFLRPRGKTKQFLLPNSIPILQNIVQRIKKKHKAPIKCCKEIAEAMGTTVKLRDLPEDFKMYTDPYPHQEIALRYMYTFGSAGLLLDPGLGKTKIVLDYIGLKNFKKSLIICPKALLFVWEDEQAVHRPDKSIYVLESTSWDAKLKSAKMRQTKWETAMSMLEEDSDEWKRARINYQSATRQIKKLPEQKAAELKKAQDADIIVVNYDKVTNGLDFLIKNFKFDFVAVDEGLIKDPKTNRTKAITKIGSLTPYRCIMSGTLVNNSPMDCFAPIRFLQPALVGGAYGRFETFYGHMIQMRNSNQKFLAGVSKANTQEIRTALDACCIVMSKDEWLDLPEKEFIVHKVPMSDEQLDLMDELVRNRMFSIDDVTVEADSPLTVMAKLYQLANGFVYHYPNKQDDQDMYDLLALGERDGYRDDEYPELEADASGCGFMDSRGRAFPEGDDGCYAGAADSRTAGRAGAGTGSGDFGTSGDYDPSFGDRERSYPFGSGLSESSRGGDSDSPTRPRSYDAPEPSPGVGSVTGSPVRGGYSENAAARVSSRYAGASAGLEYASGSSGCGDGSGDVPKGDGRDGPGSGSNSGAESTSARRTFHLGSNPKRDELGRILDSLGGARKGIIWYNLSAEVESIVQALESVGITSAQYSIIRGGTKKTGDIVRRFNRDPSQRWLICQAQAVNYGITVLGTDPEKLEQEGVHVLPEFDSEVYTHIFYTLGYSLERYIQQQDRSHRIGLKRPVEYHILLGDCLSELATFEALDDKREIRETMLVDIVNRLTSLLR